MSRLLVTNKSFELLEPYEGKLSRTVLRGESSRKGADLLDIDQYLNEAHSFGLQSVRAHFNVLAWSDDVQELRHIRNDVGSQLALMECRPRHNTVDAATLYWRVCRATREISPPRNRSTRSSSPRSVSSRRKPTINPRPALSASSCATA